MESMRRHNPAVIPRNHKVEEALAAAVEDGDLRLLERMLALLANPYDYTQEYPEEFSLPSKSGTYQTFCGT
jgi:uncharacterized protein YdiU (UPF0061 family)